MTDDAAAMNIRGFPRSLLEEAKDRASESGTTLTQYVIDLVYHDVKQTSVRVPVRLLENLDKFGDLAPHAIAVDAVIRYLELQGDDITGPAICESLGMDWEAVRKVIELLLEQRFLHRRSTSDQTSLPFEEGQG
jgi:hypothetical protein